MRITRRQFIKYVSATAAALGVSQTTIERVAQSLAYEGGLKVVWLQGQACGGCIEAASNMFISEADVADSNGDDVYDNTGIAQVKALLEPGIASTTTVEDVIIDVIDLQLMNVINSPSGDLYTSVLKRYMPTDATNNPDGGDLTSGTYVVVMEGSVPSDLNMNNVDYSIAASNYDTGNVIGIGEALSETAKNAAAVIAYGTCAAFGNIPAARNLKYDAATDKYEHTFAMGTSTYLQSKNISTPVVNVPVCPGHPEAFALVIVDAILQGVGAVAGNLDSYARPKSSLTYGFNLYGRTLHSDCSRLSDYYKGVFSGSFGSTRQGCLQNLGCQGQFTSTPCHTLNWNRQHSNTNCISAGIPCVGCGEHGFPDKNMLYRY